MRKFRIFVAAAGALCAVAGTAAADWPEKAIKVIVPFGAGGQTDQTARVFQVAIKEGNLLPQPITVINVGGHFSIGSRQVMEAAPDGYTFLLIHMALMGGEGSGVTDFGWRDFESVAATGEFCLMPVVRKDSGIDSLKQLLDMAKEKPDTLIFGANLSALNHMAGIVIEQASPGSKFRFVQIGGGSANFTALTGKQTNVSALAGAEVVSFTLLPDGTENPESQIRPLAYLGRERFGALPDMPTMKELGYDAEFCVKSWWFAPKGTPAAAIDGLAQALDKARGSQRVKDFYAKTYAGPIFLSGDALKQDLADTWRRIEPVAKLAKKK